jgi:hypothetical protein
MVDRPPPKRRKQVVRFTKREAVRLTRAVREAGGGKLTIDPATGLYTVIIGDGQSEPEANSWDRVLNAAHKDRAS